MPPLGNLQGFRLLDQERRPLFRTRSRTCGRRLRIGLAPAPGQIPRRPSDRHVGYLVLDDRQLLAVLVVVEDATLSLSMKRTPWTSQPS